MRSILLGGVIAPLAAPIIFFLGVLLVSTFHDSSVAGLHDWQAALLAAIAFVLPVSYLVTWIPGVPYIFWLRSRSQLTTLNVCMSAIIFGGIGAWGYQWIGKAESLQAGSLAVGALLGAGLALSVAITFCAVIGTPLKSTA